MPTIPNLPAATTPLTGAELMVVEQGGETRQVSSLVLGAAAAPFAASDLVLAADSNARALVWARFLTKDADGVDVVIPGDSELVELQIYNTNQFRMRLGEVGGSQFAREAGNGTYELLSITTGFKLVSIIADSGSNGAITREIGKALVNLDAITPANYSGTSLAASLDPIKLYQNAVEAANIATQIKDAVDVSTAPLSPFLPTVNDPYMEDLVEDIIVDFGVDFRGYVLNWRSDTVGSTRRLHFFLRDPIRGANIASWTQEANTDWSAEVGVGKYESVYLSGASLGAPNPALEYVGTGCTLFLKPGVADFTKGSSSHTTTATGGINPNRVWSVEETQRRILEGRGHRNKLRTVGTDGDFATYQEAQDYLLRDIGIPKNDIQRGWWPFSDICTPAHQWTLQALPGHSEVKPAVVPAGVAYARGILVWMGMTVRALSDTNIKGETTLGVQTYVFDYNLGGRIISEPGALFWTDGATTSAVHQDAQNGVSAPSEANAADPTAGLLHFRITGLIEGGTYQSVIFPWAAGCSDGQDIRFKGPVLEVTDGTSANFVAHTSPDNLFPGYYYFDDVTLKGGTGDIAFINTNTVVARHGVGISNSAVDAVVTNGAGAEAWVRLGKQPGVTYDAGMEP